MSESLKFFFRQIHPNRWRENTNGKFRLTSDIFTDNHNAVSLRSATGITPQRAMDDYMLDSVGLAVISYDDLTVSKNGEPTQIAEIIVDNKGYEGHATLSYPIGLSTNEMDRRSEILRNAVSKRGLLIFCYNEPLRVFPPYTLGEGNPFDPEIEYTELW